MRKSILITALGSVVFFFYLGMYLSTISYDREWGEFSANKTYLINFLLGLIILITGLYSIYQNKHNQNPNNTYYIGFGLVSLCIAIISFSNMITLIIDKGDIYQILINIIKTIFFAILFSLIISAYKDNKENI